MTAVPTTAPPTVAPPAAPPPPRRRARVPRAFVWMVVPALLLFFAFHTVPVLQAVFYSFTDYRGYGEFDLVGLQNYVALLADRRVLASYLFTFRFALVATVLVNVVALGLAVALNARIRAKGFFRGLFFVPNVLGILIIGYVFNYLFAFSLPALGEALGIPALSSSILADPELAWVGIVFVAVWQAVAFNVIIYLAGLQTVPAELYEAATIDGAGPWRMFRSITFPTIAAFFTINMVLTLKNMMMVFDLVAAMTGGGPGTSTESISWVIFTSGFEGGEYAYQTANAIVYFLLILVLSYVQLRVLERREVSA